MSEAPPAPATRRFALRLGRPARAAAVARPRGASPSSAPRFGDRANAWLRAAAEAVRPFVRRGADAAFVAAVRAAEAAFDAAWEGGADGAAGAPAPADLLALRLALRRDGFGAGGGAAAAAATTTRALGLACAAARRTVGRRPFDVQLLGARALLDGRLAEMATGEGKTLTVALAAAVAALAGVPVHVVTANDYLVARDAAALRPLYAALGLSVGSVLQGDAPAERAAAYECDIACVTAKELVFDHLRDSLLPPPPSAAAARCLRGLHLAIVDEADSILIDEARVPLRLSQPVDADAVAAALADAERALRAARGLREGRHFRLAADGLAARLTAAGQAAVAAAAAADAAAPPAAGALPLSAGAPAPVGTPATAASSSAAGGAVRPPAASGPWRHPAHREHAVCAALTALHRLRRERHYVVRDAQVLIVDETTGRAAPGRAWADGLHTLVELKEGCVPRAPLVTVAQSTYPRFFARYPRLAGLSGTLRDARGELLQAYGLAVRRVPLRLPCRRRVLPQRLFASHAALWQAVACRIADLHAAGRPVLVGTDSVADALALSALLRSRGLPHACLHAGDTGDTGNVVDIGDTGAGNAAAGEAAIVARAGRRGAITVSTNMAGRGTDIALDGHALAHGGLHVICCQLNAARRIDRQLAGRAARQGDDGSVETWLSLDSALFASVLPRGPLAAALLPRLPSPLLRLLARGVQRRAERCQREQRRRLAAQDRLLHRQLGFGGPSS